MVAFLLPFQHQLRKSDTRISKATTEEDGLVKGLQAGNQHAVEELYNKYASSLMGIITRIVKSDEVAEDVLQETFVKIWKSIEKYDSAKGRLFTWMANLAKNTAIDELRSKQHSNSCKTETINEIPVDTFLLRSQIEFNPEVIGVRQLLKNLKQDQQYILDLVYFKGYTQVEVSECLNIPLGSVKTKIRLSILTLRQYFNETNLKTSSLIA
jgi:RNA polymerase sigma factor (sigma-70 family)